MSTYKHSIRSFTLATDPKKLSLYIKLILHEFLKLRGLGK